MKSRSTIFPSLRFSQTFAKTQQLAPYLTRLGIIAYYGSSFLAARPGSTRGYDLYDQSRINQELVGQEGFQMFSKALHTNGFGLLFPNHWEGRGYRSIFTGVVLHVPAAGEQRELRVADIFSVLPVALLVNETEGAE